MDSAVTVIGLTVTRLREFFTPSASVPPLGGGTDLVNILAGEAVIPPPWVGVGEDDEVSCGDCGPYLWIRLVSRWRTDNFPQKSITGSCGSQRAITLEAGIARCHPLDGTPAELEQLAAIQWDDSWRIDSALCAAMQDAEKAGKATASALGDGEPWGPEGLVLAWLQPAYAQLSRARST